MQEITGTPSYFHIEYADYTGFAGYNENIQIVSIFGSTLNEFILNCEKENLVYLVIERDSVTEITYPFLTNVFENEREYAYLKNVLDTEKLGFKEIHVKVFELDYTKFHELNPKND